jgi:hypothetical protein
MAGLVDLSTNVHGIAGDPTAYERGIAEALRQARNRDRADLERRYGQRPG